MLVFVRYGAGICTLLPLAHFVIFVVIEKDRRTMTIDEPRYGSVTYARHRID